MSSEQVSANLKDKSNGKPLTWSGLIVRILSGYTVFAIASQIFDSYPTGHNWPVAQKVFDFALLSLSQFLVVYVTTAVVALLVARVPTSNRSKPLQPFLNGALIATMLILCLLIFGDWYASNISKRLASERSSAIGDSEIPLSTIKPVQVFTTIQSAEGVTEADLDQVALANLENWIVETMLQKGRSKYAEMGYNPNDFKPKIKAKSVYVVAGGKKLAVIKVNMDDSMRSVTVMGINGTELYRVSCIRASNHDIPVWSGECGNEVRKTFGVSIQP